MTALPSLTTAWVDSSTPLTGAASWKDTIVIVTADHGEHLGEHQLFGHGVSFTNLIHVPLFIIYPPTVPAGLVMRGAGESPGRTGHDCAPRRTG